MVRKPADQERDASPPSTSDELQTLNFKVPPAFKKAYKGYAVAQGMTMLDLLKEGFELSKARRGGSA